jgi:hypothetical protein
MIKNSEYSSDIFKYTINEVNMKKYASTAIILVIILLSAYSNSISKEPGLPGVGAFLSLKGGVNAAEVPNGIKNGFVFNGIPDFGLTGYLPFSKTSTVGISLDLAYNTYAYKFKYPAYEETIKVSYFGIGPSLNASGFLLGLNIGIPLSASLEGDFSGSPDTENYATFVEIRIGGMIPVYEDKTGILNINLMGGYFLTGQENTDKTNTDDKYNPHPASISFGISYLFNINSKQY